MFLKRRKDLITLVSCHVASRVRVRSSMTQPVRFASSARKVENSLISFPVCLFVIPINTAIHLCNLFYRYLLGCSAREDSFCQPERQVIGEVRRKPVTAMRRNARLVPPTPHRHPPTLPPLNAFKMAYYKVYILSGDGRALQ